MSEIPNFMVISEGAEISETRGGDQVNKGDSPFLFENIMEHVVDEVIEDLLKVPTLQVCRCDRCYIDIKALALNRLPPKYVVTERGEIFAKLGTFRNQVRVDVLKAVIEAIEIVRQRPSHSVLSPVFKKE